MAKDKENIGNETTEEVDSAVEEFRKRRADRLDAMKNCDTDEEEAPVEEAPEEEPIAEEEEVVEDAAEEEIVAEEEETDPVQVVRERRAHRDEEGDPEDIGKAMGVIAQQDEDIDKLLGVVDAMRNPNEKAEQEGEEEVAVEEEVENDEEDDSNDKAAYNAFRELLRVIRVGDKLNMDGLEAMSPKNAKKAVLKKLKPTLNMDGKSEAYVSAAFDMAISEMKNRKTTNYQRQQMQMRKDSKTESSVGSAKDARQRMIDRRMKKEDK